MSIVLQGSTSGSVTLQEPAIAGTTVLTLPAVTGTVLTTTSPKAGNVIQVVTAEYSTQVSISNTTTWTDSGLSASITPSSSSSKILVIISQATQVERASTSPTLGNVRLLRGATSIWSNTDFVGGIAATGAFSVANWKITGSIVYLDSPATTSSTTYKTQGRPNSAEASYSVNFQNAGTNTSTITLLEIAV
jgi:hypothetical protein